MEPDADCQRLDKWVWHARLVRTRNMAAELVRSGHVRLNGVRQTAPGHVVKTSDVVTVALHSRVRVLRVVGFAPRRGDAGAARATYDELEVES